MTPEIEIYDTTLRDGTQGEGITFSVADKLRIAERLDAFGVHYIEGGWPGSNPRDIEFFEQAKHRTFRRARLAAFGSTRRKDTRVDERRAGAAAARRRHAGRDHLRQDAGCCTFLEVLQTTPEENLAMIGDTVRFLKEHGKFVVYDAEHAFDGMQGRPGVRAGDLAGGRTGRRRRRHAVRHERRIAARRRSRSSRATPAAPEGAARHPHARRHRAGGCQRAGLASMPARRTSRARSTATASGPATAT